MAKTDKMEKMLINSMSASVSTYINAPVGKPKDNRNENDNNHIINDGRALGITPNLVRYVALIQTYSIYFIN